MESAAANINAVSPRYAAFDGDIAFNYKGNRICGAKSQVFLNRQIAVNEPDLGSVWRTAGLKNGIAVAPAESLAPRQTSPRNCTRRMTGLLITGFCQKPVRQPAVNTRFHQRLLVIIET